MSATPPALHRRQRRALRRAAAQALAIESLADFVRGAWPLVEPERRLVWNWHLDIICGALERQIRGDPEYRQLVICIPPGCCKPVYTAAMITMGDGSRKQLGDVVVGDRVMTHEGRPRRVTAVHEQGTIPTLKITTYSGRSVTAAPDHPFLTPEGWVNAGDLAVGQSLALVVGDDRPGPSRPVEEYRLIGYFIGDGNVTNYDVGYPTAHQLASITCYDDEQCADIVRCAEVLGFTAKIGKSPKKRVLNLSGGVRPWLRETGLAGKTSHTKRVPEFVFSSSNEQIANFLGAYFACDGTMSRKGADRRDCAISITSVCRGLLEDVQHLMLRLGVFTRLRTRRRMEKGAPYEFYMLEWATQDDAAKFIARVPIAGDKGRRGAAWGVKRRTFDNRHIADPIVSIESAGEQACRCLTVEEDHSFVAEDFAVHNSLLVSVFAPAWEWLHYPGRRFVFFANDDKLSERDSRRTRDIITDPWYRALVELVERARAPDRQPWVLAHDQNEKANFENTRKGFRQCLSLGSRVTGKRGDRLMVDDPLDAKDVMLGSPEQVATRLAEVQTKLGGVLASRINDPATATRTMIMQRLADGDPADIAIKSGDWKVINLSMEFDPTDPLNHPDDPRTEPGELMFPAMFPKTFLDALKKPDALGLRHYSAQYLQRPTPADGNLFKRKNVERYFGEAPWLLAPTLDEVAITVDCTFGKSKGSDNVAMHVWGRKGSRRYLLDRVCRRMNLPEAKRELRALCKKWPTARVKLVELKANGQGIVDELGEGDELNPPIAGMLGFLPDPYGGKYERAQRAAVSFEGNNVELAAPQHLEGVQEFVETVCAFPHGRFDDDIDAMSQLFIRWSDAGRDDPKAKAEAMKRSMERAFGAGG